MFIYFSMENNTFCNDYSNINNAKDWMLRNIPSCEKIDINNAINEYKFPKFVIDWIKYEWTKESDLNGGIYYNKKWKNINI